MLTDLGIKATSRPAATILPGTSVCPRCGITRHSKAERGAYCRDCLPEARSLGWVPRQAGVPGNQNARKKVSA